MTTPHVLDKLTTQDAWNVIANQVGDLQEHPEAHGLTRLDALTVLDALEQDIAGAKLHAMAEAHRAGETLDAIGRQLGISRAAVWNRLERADLLPPR